MKKALCVILILVVLVLLISCVFSQIKEYISIVEYAERVVATKASVDLGSDFQIYTSYYRPEKEMCFVGCIDGSNKCAIMYIVHTGSDKTKWEAEQMAKRTGFGASSLFSAFGRTGW